jgi:hypothetical protein
MLLRTPHATGGESAAAGRCWCCIVALATLSLFGGCSTTVPPASTPAPRSDLGLRDGLRAAAQVQGGGAGRSMAIGEGASMQQVFAGNSVIVFQPLDFDKLEPLMLVAYRTRDNQIVTHQLVRYTVNGWVAQGTNNPAPDVELVTRDNLLGQVYAVFFAQGGAPAP